MINGRGRTIVFLYILWQSLEDYILSLISLFNYYEVNPHIILWSTITAKHCHLHFTRITINVTHDPDRAYFYLFQLSSSWITILSSFYDLCTLNNCIYFSAFLTLSLYCSCYRPGLSLGHHSDDFFSSLYDFSAIYYLIQILLMMETILGYNIVVHHVCMQQK